MEERPKERRPEHRSRHNRTRPTAHALRRPREAKGTRTSERYLGSARIDLAPSTPLKTNGAHPPRAFRPAKGASGFPSGFFRRGKKRTVGTRAHGRARRTRASLSIDRFSSVCPRGSRAVSARFTHRVDPTRARFRATCSSDSCSRCFQRGTEIARSRGSARGTPPALDRPRARTFGRAPHARETRLTPHVPPIDHDDDGFISQLLPRRPRPRARPVRPVSNSPFRALCTVRGRGVSFWERVRRPVPPRRRARTVPTAIAD